MPTDDARALAEQLERPCEHMRSSLSICVDCLAAALAAAREAGRQAEREAWQQIGYDSVSVVAVERRLDAAVTAGKETP